MSITKADLRIRVLQAADAVNSTRWDSDPNGEVDQHIGVVMDREWRRILNANPFYNVGRRTVTSASDGYYALSDLDSGSADSAQRLNRVIAFSIDSIVYEEVRIDQYLLPSTDAPQPQFIWAFEGAKILAYPVTAAKDAVVVVNWIPPRQENLAGESSVIIFPDGYENVLTFSAGAMLLTSKGASEAARGQVLEYQAEALRQDMLQDVMRRSTAPIRMRYHDSTWDWGG